MLLALLSHVRLLNAEARGAPCAGLRALGPALYLAATLSKSVTVAAPASVFALDLALVGGPRIARRAAHLAGYALVTAAMVPITLEANRLGHDPHADVIRLDGYGQRAAKAAVTVCFCLGKALYPAKLSPHYALVDLYFEPGHDNSEARLAVAALAFLAAAAASLAASDVDGRATLAVVVHVLAHFLPTCGLVQHGMIQKGGDRYVYLPLLGVAVGGAVALAALITRSARAVAGIRFRASALLALVAGGALLGAAVDASSRLCPIWRSDVPLLEHCLDVDPNDWRCLDIYAEHLMHRNDPRALPLMDRGLRAVDLMNIPDSPKLLNYRGKSMLLLGNGKDGCEAFHLSTEIYPDFAVAWNNAAICDLRDPNLRDFQEPKFERALALAYRDEHTNAAALNLERYRAWKGGGYAGTFDGTLVY